MSTDADLQSWPEVPSIAHFCSLFRQAFDLLEFDIQEFEESLLLMGTSDDVTRLVHKLMVKLLVGCLPMYKSRIKEDNYSMYLRRFLQTKQEEAEEDGIEYNFNNPFQEDDKDYSDLDLKDKVSVLNQLCEFRLEAADVADKVKKLEATSLRVDPLGMDSEGTTLWYFYGTRLYREDVVEGKATDPKKAKDKKKKRKEKKEKKRKRKRSMEEDSDDDSVASSKAVWSLACLTEDDWIELTEKYKKSRKKEDRHLYHTLNDNFLPEITTMFAEKEKEEKQKLLALVPKRTSTRLEKLKTDQEQRDRALAILLEEESRYENQGKRSTRKGNLDPETTIDIEKEREERARQREMMKEMRAKRAAERLVQAEFSDDVVKQKEIQKNKKDEKSPKKSEEHEKKRKRSFEHSKERSHGNSRRGIDSKPHSLPYEDHFSSGEPSSAPTSDTEDDESYRPPTKTQNCRSNFTNALLRAGTKSTKDSALLEKPVRKTPGLLLQTAGKGLLNKVANKRPNNVAATPGPNSSGSIAAIIGSGSGGGGSGSSVGGGSSVASGSLSTGISFGLYGGYLSVEPNSSTNLGSAFDEKIYSNDNCGKTEEPARKVFSNWGGEFFKKNLDFRTNTNKILEKMQLGKSPGFGEVNGTSKTNQTGARLFN